MPRLLTVIAAMLVLMLAVQLYAQDIPDRWMPGPPKMPEPDVCMKYPVPPWLYRLGICPPQPPIREPPIRPPPRIPVELKGYIYAVVVDPVDPLRMPGRTEYYLHTVDGKIYRLELSRAKFYLCGHLVDYVGTGKLVIVKGYLVHDVVPLNNIYGYHLLIAVEVRDPAYPRCR
jgi:hypothetical protein